MCDQEWFARRGLLEILKEQDRPDAPTPVKNEHWTYYARKITEPMEGDFTCAGDLSVDNQNTYGGLVPVWRPAFHGTWFYALWNLLLTGEISVSSDASKGHEFNSLGTNHVYCSPKFDTALDYARAHNVFGDGVYHMCCLELRVDMRYRHKAKRDGGNQWTFPSHAVRIVGVWICNNCGNRKGCEHLRFWNSEDECIPVGGQQARFHV